MHPSPPAHSTAIGANTPKRPACADSDKQLRHPLPHQVASAMSADGARIRRGRHPPNVHASSFCARQTSSTNWSHGLTRNAHPPHHHCPPFPTQTTSTWHYRQAGPRFAPSQHVLAHCDNPGTLAPGRAEKASTSASSTSQETYWATHLLKADSHKYRIAYAHQIPIPDVCRACCIRHIQRHIIAIGVESSGSSPIELDSSYPC
jgi:hypothetical protein